MTNDDRFVDSVKVADRRPVGGAITGYDEQNLVMVMDSAGATQERFLYGPSGQVLGYDIASGGTGGGDYFYWSLSDGQGTVRSVSMSLPADGGAVETGVLDSLVYDSFGQVTSQSNPDYQPGFTYDGKWQDPLTGLSLMNGTWYDPVNSVYVSDPPDTNPYEFDGDAPTGANTTPTLFTPDVNPSPVRVMDAGSGGTDIPVYADDGSGPLGGLNWPAAFLDFGSATQNGSYQPQNAGGAGGSNGGSFSTAGPYQSQDAGGAGGSNGGSFSTTGSFQSQSVGGIPSVPLALVAPGPGPGIIDVPLYPPGTAPDPYPSFRLPNGMNGPLYIIPPGTSPFIPLKPPRLQTPLADQYGTIVAPSEGQYHKPFSSLDGKNHLIITIEATPTPNGMHYRIGRTPAYPMTEYWDGPVLHVVVIFPDDSILDITVVGG